MTRRRNNGLRKRCGCSRRDWAKCAHPWHLNFAWRGAHYRISLDKHIGRPLKGKTEAAAEADRVRDAIRNGTFVAAGEEAQPAVSSAMTLRQVGEQFIERFSKARGKSSWQDDAYNLKALYAFVSADSALGDRAIGAVTTDDLEVFHEKLRGERAGSTSNHYRQLLLALFGWTAKKGYITRDPAAVAELPRMTQARRSRRLNDDEERRLLDHANPRLYRVIVAALETGARQGELLALQWRDVDLERREMRIRAENTKDQQDRHIPVSSRLAAVLEMAKLDPEGEAYEAEDFVFGDVTGAHVAQVRTAWGNTLRAAEITDLHFHDLRHEAGSRFLEGGMPLHHVKEMLGHANIKTTDTYLNVTRIGLQESMRKLDEIRKVCTPVAQTCENEAEISDDAPLQHEGELIESTDVVSGGVDGTRTRGLRRDRPAF